MNRKGQVLAITFLVKIIFVVALIILSFLVGREVLEALFGNDVEAASVRNMEIMAGKIEALMEQEGDFASDTDTFHIGDEYAMVGFDTGNRRTLITGAVEEMNEDDVYGLKKPEECGEEACLCIYEDLGEREREVVECSTFPQDIKFYGNLEGFSVGVMGAEKFGINDELQLHEEARIRAEELVLPGGDLSWHLGGTSGEELGKEFYMEKIMEDGTAYILIIPNTFEVRQRYKYIGECSNTEGVCAGEKFSTVVPNPDLGEEQPPLVSCDRISEESDVCTANGIDECDYNEKIQGVQGVCACGQKAYSSGYCINKNAEIFHSPIPCEEIDSCKDYCEGSCNSREERKACELDYCRLGECTLKDISGAPVIECL